MSENPIWSPSQAQVQGCKLTEFAERFELPRSATALHEWSINNRVSFWSHLIEYCEVRIEKGEKTLDETKPFLDSHWFADSNLNFAQNLLRYDDEKVALVGVNEAGHRQELTYSQLQERVAKLANRFSTLGITTNDRVAAWLPNTIDTVIAMLATTSCGAIWTSCSPDFGVPGALDRFGQIEPKLLLATNQYQYNGRHFDVSENVTEIQARISSIQYVMLRSDNPSVCEFQTVYNEPESSLRSASLPFNHPVYIMYSSGTTGQPKCIVHGAGGTLLQHLKEHQLHSNLTRESVLFFFTTTGWMMWNWLVSGLATGCTLVLYDGSPFYPGRDRLIKLIEEERITAFGVGAKYIASLERLKVEPKRGRDLSCLELMLSTGSPLLHESFDFVYNQFKEDVWLASISGGTDLVSCFALGHPWLPVHRGEIQSPGLGMAVDIFDDDGNSLTDLKGELVCTESFPSAPIGFWNDEGDEKYHAAYFDRFPQIWAHGDFAEVNSSTGGLVIHGRSDAVLNPGGVRIGTAEIYRQLEQFEEIVDAVCVGQDWDGDTRIVLFVVLTKGLRLNRLLRKDIRAAIRENTSPRHVPAKIEQVSDVPRTRSGKVAELAVRNIIQGLEVKNTSALENPECLSEFSGHDALSE